MLHASDYLAFAEHPVASIVTAVDKDVERGEDILMLGYCAVLIAPIFAPLLPPKVLLPAMSVAFLISVCLARFNFYGIRRKLNDAVASVQSQGRSTKALTPIVEVFSQYPKFTLSEGFNPMKNWKRTLKSTLGAMMINPFWMPIFYMMGLQFAEDMHFNLLNKAVIEVEKTIELWRLPSS